MIGITQEAKERLAQLLMSQCTGACHIYLRDIPIIPAPDKWEPTHVGINGGAYKVVGAVVVPVDTCHHYVLHMSENGTYYARTKADFNASLKPINPHRELIDRVRREATKHKYMEVRDVLALCDALEAK